METLRIGRPPRLSARARLHWVGFHAWWTLVVGGGGAVALVALLTVIDVLTL